MHQCPIYIMCQDQLDLDYEQKIAILEIHENTAVDIFDPSFEYFEVDF